MSVSLIDLPTEVIAHIFSFVSHKKDRRNLALICKKLHQIVRHQSKKHNHLNLTGRGKKTPLSLFNQHEEFPFQKVTLHESQIVGRYNSFWQRHGAEITQINLKCISTLDGIGSKLKDLFPNLTSLSEQLDLNYKWMIFADPKICLSEKIEELHLECFCVKMLDSILELFPGLKHLKLHTSISSRHNNSESEVQELKDFLDKWLLKLENITLSIKSCLNNYLHLLAAFDGLTNEKLSFDFLRVSLTPQNIIILKSFFSIARHIKTLEINSVDIVLDSDLCSLIDKNATIDRLIIWGYELVKLEGLINARGVKEIIINGTMRFNRDRFSSEALLKVKKVALRGQPQEITKMPLFRNLRKLTLTCLAVGNKELEFVIKRFPILEELRISNLCATNGHLMANLTHLRSLQIIFSPRLTNAFFDFCSELPNMKRLLISNVPKLSLTGVESIVANFPHLESIKFEKCDLINEECIDLVAKNLFYIESIKFTFRESRAAVSKPFKTLFKTPKTLTVAVPIVLDPVNQSVHMAGDQTDRTQRFYFTPERLENSPSRKYGMDADSEFFYRKKAAVHIKEMGQQLRLSELAVNTAIVYMHRFYAFHSLTLFHRNSIALAALFLAAKVEDQPQKAELVIKTAAICLKQELPDPRKKAFSEQAEDLVFNENFLLQTLGFDVGIEHPQMYIIKICHLIDAPKDLVRAAYFVASVSLQMTTWCLQYKPIVVACFCIHSACKWLRWEISQSKEGRCWFECVDQSVTMNLFNKMTEEFQLAFEREKLKSKKLPPPNVTERNVEGDDKQRPPNAVPGQAMQPPHSLRPDKAMPLKIKPATIGVQQQQPKSSPKPSSSFSSAKKNTTGGDSKQDEQKSAPHHHPALTYQQYKEKYGELKQLGHDRKLPPPQATDVKPDLKQLMPNSPEDKPDSKARRMEDQPSSSVHGHPNSMTTVKQEKQPPVTPRHAK